MKAKTLFSVVFACFVLQQLSAQVEVTPAAKMAEHLQQFEQIVKDSSNPFNGHAKRLQKGSDIRKANLARVAQSVAGTAVKAPVPFVHYAVPPMSEMQYLPETYPSDGVPCSPVRIFAAQNEYEPGSFIIYATENLGKSQFAVSDLKSADGKIFPKSKLDLKTVKVWYQAGNAWYSYFQDKGLKLCPELLLHDEDLIKVDTQKVSNYARLTDKNGNITYHWLTPPDVVDNVIEGMTGYHFAGAFRCMLDNFRDAPEFAGATLNEGEFKQFFLTAHVTEDCAPGIYHGSIALKDSKGNAIGSVPVSLRVLPFKLPEPMQYKNMDKPFRTEIAEYNGIEYIRSLNGNHWDLAEKQLVDILKNYAAHNYVIPGFRNAYDRLDLVEAGGIKKDFLVTRQMLLTQPAEMRFDAKRKKEEHIRRFGHNDFSLGWGDEYGLDILRGILPMVKIYKEEGFGFWSNSRHTYNIAAWASDFFTPPNWPDYRNHITANKYTFISPDNEFGWYACQHVGVENPAFNRRQNGLAPWRAGMTCGSNYAIHLSGYGDARGNTFRTMNFFYMSGSGVLDAIQWEAFREAIDDIRYATLIQQLARPLVNSKADVNGEFAARKALQFLADLNTDDKDLSMVRLEMIRHILALQKFSK